MEEHVPAHAQMEEEQMAEPMNTYLSQLFKHQVKTIVIILEIMIPLSSDHHALLFDVPEVWYGRACLLRYLDT